MGNGGTRLSKFIKWKKAAVQKPSMMDEWKKKECVQEVKKPISSRGMEKKEEKEETRRTREREQKWTDVRILFVLFLCCFWALFVLNTEATARAKESQKENGILVRCLVFSACWFASGWIAIITIEPCSGDANAGEKNVGRVLFEHNSEYPHLT